MGEEKSIASSKSAIVCSCASSRSCDSETYASNLAFTEVVLQKLLYSDQKRRTGENEDNSSVSKQPQSL